MKRSDVGFAMAFQAIVLMLLAPLLFVQPAGADPPEVAPPATAPEMFAQTFWSWAWGVDYAVSPMAHMTAEASGEESVWQIRGFDDDAFLGNALFVEMDRVEMAEVVDYQEIPETGGTVEAAVNLSVVPGLFVSSIGEEMPVVALLVSYTAFDRDVPEAASENLLLYPMYGADSVGEAVRSVLPLLPPAEGQKKPDCVVIEEGEFCECMERCRNNARDGYGICRAALKAELLVCGVYLLGVVLLCGVFLCAPAIHGPLTPACLTKCLVRWGKKPLALCIAAIAVTYPGCLATITFIEESCMDGCRADLLESTVERR